MVLWELQLCLSANLFGLALLTWDPSRVDVHAKWVGWGCRTGGTAALLATALSLLGRGTSPAGSTTTLSLPCMGQQVSALQQLQQQQCGMVLTRYTMRSLKRYDGRSGGVWSVASPWSWGMTCRG